MPSLDLTPQEIQTGKIIPAHLQQAVQALQEDGYVILNELLDRGPMALLAEKMVADAQEILSRDDVPFNFNRGNIQQDPPPFHPYLFKEVLVNDIVIAITKAMLGPGLKNAFYSGNTALPKAGGRQPVHADLGQLWQDLPAATPPYALVVNVLPVDVSPHNGSTEIWPGTHRDTSISYQSGDIKVSEEKLAERRKVAPGFQYTARAGSVVIRDMRLWHAGMPNPSDTPRPMIAMIHYISWWSDLEPMVFPKGTESYLEHPDLRSVVKFVDGEVDYLKRHQAFDLMK
jgi:ectoine hydroxylase-related dioxygenase (phytanoyl-CoA dioxygenase family)